MNFFGRQGTTNRAVFYKPGISVQYAIPLSRSLAVIPAAEMGYSIVGLSNKEFGYKENITGWNPGATLRLIWTREANPDFYIFGRFDYIYLHENPSFTLIESYRKIYLTSFGVGVRLKSGKS